MTDDLNARCLAVMDERDGKYSRRPGSRDFLARLRASLIEHRNNGAGLCSACGRPWICPRVSVIAEVLGVEP